jgi:aspartokinase/homoserine dehydrogenase 1
VRDLSGRDVAAKLVILLRDFGIDVDVSDVVTEPLTRERAARGSELAYVASYRDGIASAGVRSVADDSPFASLRAGENRVVLRTNRYSDVPLTIAGPGAGPEVTAAGVLAEILDVSAQRW